MSGENILVVYYAPTGYIENDIRILRKHYQVKAFSFRGIKDLPALVGEVKNSDIVISWFGAVHAGVATELAKLFRKKSIIIEGGNDALVIKELNYGFWISGRWHHKLIVKRALKDADKLVAVSKFTKRELIKNTGITRDVDVVYIGVDPQFWKPKGEKENLILTVANVRDWFRARIKGLDVFFKVAESLPEYKFEVVGVGNDFIKELERHKPRNVTISSFLEPEKLREKYQKAKIYAQLSRIESFSVATVEAMLCGCIPVVTKVGALPEVVGDAGFYVPYGDITATVKAIKEAMHSELNPRNRGMYFSLDRRERELLRILKELDS